MKTHNLAKVGVEGSNPFARSSLIHVRHARGGSALDWRVAEKGLLPSRSACTPQSALPQPRNWRSLRVGFVRSPMGSWPSEKNYRPSGNRSLPYTN
jgi:hypothetical protein